MNILVCGGAGYIGSHTVYELIEQGHSAVVADDLFKGHRAAVHKEAKFYEGDLRDADFLDKVFSENKIDAVIDFAAFSLVGESCSEPLKYFDNNVYGTVRLLEAMVRAGVNKIVFSSTAATYGEPENIPILERDRTLPTNPYGETKLTVEKVLKWSDAAYGIKYAALRYFNAAGAHISGEIGEDHSPESHLIPIIIQAALGQREHIAVFGDDYPTPDGTCIRDYIHVTDLADAHIKAIEKLFKDETSGIYNLGNGKGFSVKEVIEETRRVTEREIKAVIEGRRPGDPSTLIASSEKAVKELGWKPRFNTLTQIIESAWKWHKTHPKGYNDK
ncbi:MAG: UDP-glucose 4-epimerase GalE [Clostridiales bacterium]|nr:UDP-glucose 4-epimerase GalE [Clostridiales bacterium]